MQTGNQREIGRKPSKGTTGTSMICCNETSPTSEFDVHHQTSQNHYLLTVYENQPVNANDVLQGEFLFDDSIEVQDLNLFEGDTHTNQARVTIINENEESRPIIAVEDHLLPDEVDEDYHSPDNDADYIPNPDEDNSSSSSDSAYDIQEQVLEPSLHDHEIEQEPRDQVIEENKRPKKRLRNENNWARNVNKLNQVT